MAQLFYLSFIAVFGLYGLGLAGFVDMPTPEYRATVAEQATQNTTTTKTSFTNRISQNRVASASKQNKTYTLKAMR